MEIEKVHVKRVKKSTSKCAVNSIEETKYVFHEFYKCDNISFSRSPIYFYTSFSVHGNEKEKRKIKMMLLKWLLCLFCAPSYLSARVLALCFCIRRSNDWFCKTYIFSSYCAEQLFRHIHFCMPMLPIRSFKFWFAFVFRHKVVVVFYSHLLCWHICAIQNTIEILPAIRWKWYASMDAWHERARKTHKPYNAHKIECIQNKKNLTNGCSWERRKIDQHTERITTLCRIIDRCGCG